MDKKAMKTEAAQPTDGRLAEVVERNIGALITRRRLEEKKKGMQDRLADGITRFAGSMAFVYLHIVLFGLWISQSGLAASSSLLRPLLCHPGHVRFGGSDLPLDICLDYPESHGGTCRQAGGSRSADQPAGRA